MSLSLWSSKSFDEEWVWATMEKVVKGFTKLAWLYKERVLKENGHWPWWVVKWVGCLWSNLQWCNSRRKSCYKAHSCSLYCTDLTYVACIIHISYPSSPRSGYYHAVSEPRPLDSFLLSQSPGSLTAWMRVGLTTSDPNSLFFLFNIID